MSRYVFCYGQCGASNCTVLHNFDWEVFDDSKKENFTHGPKTQVSG